MNNDQASPVAQTPNQKSEFPDPMEYTPRPLKPLPKELIPDSPPATAKITMTASIDSIVGEGRPSTRLEMKRRAFERKTGTCH